MRPLSPTSLFTPATGCHGTRPWWFAGSSNAGSGWTRCDGWEATDNGYLYYSSAPITGDSDPSAETPEGSSYDELLAAIDAKWPLPPPPLRAGQVWLLEARQAITTALLNSTMHGFLRVKEIGGFPGGSIPGLLPGDDLYGVEAFAESAFRRMWVAREARHAMMGFNHAEGPGYLLGDQFLLSHDAERLLLRDDPLVKAYLIADPVNPSFTVWTGAKEGEW